MTADRRTLPWRWALAALLLPALLALAWQAWTIAGVRALAEDWRRAHAARDLAAMEALHRWEGVSPGSRARIRLVLAQELELPVAEVRAVPLAADDLRLGPDSRLNGEPVGAVEIRCDADARLVARLLVGRDGLGFRFLLAVPAAGP